MIPIANIFQPLIDVFDRVILFFHDTVGFGWGGSIIALTVVVRTLMLPLTIKQFRSMQKLQQHAPEIKALQQKYKDDRQRLNQEMMKFYQENQVNPFGSCLPLVLQIPVFISLFYMLREDLKVDICFNGSEAQLQAYADKVGKPISEVYCNAVEPGSAQFLFIPDLTAPGTGGVLVVLILLYIVSQLLSSILMSVTADKTQRYIMFGLPFIFVLFVINFPTGLLVYWITTNFWTVGQQYFIRRSTGQLPTWLGGDGALTPPTPAAAGAGGAAVAPAAASSGGGKAKAKATPKAEEKPKAPPPPSPRKKKKRSGRRR